MAVHLDGSDSPRCRAHWLKDGYVPGYPYPACQQLTCYASCMSVPKAIGKPTGMREHLLTAHFPSTALTDLGCNQGELDSHFGCMASVGTHPAMPKL